MAEIAWLELALGVALGLSALFPLILYLLRQWKLIMKDGKIEPHELIALLTGGQKLAEEAKEAVEEALEEASEIAEAVESGDKTLKEVAEETAAEVKKAAKDAKKKSKK